MRPGVSTKILLSFVVLLLAFSVAASLSVARLRGEVRDLRILNQGYLRLAFALNDLEATQASLVNLIDEEHTLGFAALRRMRLMRLDDARRIVHGAMHLNPRESDVAFLRRMERDVLTLTDDCRQSEATLKLVSGAGGSAAGARRVADGATLARREGEILRRLRAARDLAKGQVTALSLNLERTEQRAVWVSLGLIVAVVVVGLGAAVAANRAVAPLGQLAESTRAIAGGNYSKRVVAQSHDEIGRLARAFNQMAEALEEREHRLMRSERLAAAGRVAAHVAHEIRNPLSSIGLNAELLEEELSESAEARRLLSAIRHEIDRLEALTEEYLRFGRLPHPKLEPEALSPMVSGLLDFVAQQFREARIEVRALLREVPLVMADETQLRQVFLNLLRNAGEAMPSGGVLAVETRVANANVEVRISDTGPGIPTDQLGRVFEPFFTTKKGGTGLGLALAQQIVHEHGGRIEVQTTLGSGTTFVVCLPQMVSVSG